MKKIKLPPIDYKALANDLEAVKLERRGFDTGRFKPSRYVRPTQPKEARQSRRKAGPDQVHFAEALGLSHEHRSFICLSRQDAQKIFSLVEHFPKPNKRLKEAVGLAKSAVRG